MNENKPCLNILLMLGLSIFISSCDGKCEEKPDLVIPPFINGSVQVANEFRYTVVGGLDYPSGTQVFLSNTTNEFYSVVRSNPFNGQPLVFYWNINSPPPFFQGANYPNQPLQIGEEVFVHRCVFNQSFPDFDCLTKDASSSKTEMKVVVKVQNGQIVDEQIKTEQTPSIPAGQYRVASFPIIINGLGTYELKFKTNADELVDERDFTNNEYIEDPSKNLGGG